MRATATDIVRRLGLLRREEGGLLLEVVFSTLVVAMVSAAVLTGVSGSVKTATKNRERSVAAQLAEQDQERMRAYKATELDGYSNTTTKTVRGIPYTVESRTDWYFDSSGTKSCTSDTNKASYLKLISTVTPQGGRPGTAVTETSLLAPPNGTLSTTKGALAVMVVDRNGAGRPNLTVNLTGGSVSQSDATNESGCANFFNVPVGTPPTTYTVTTSAPGLVDRTGSASPSLTTGITGGQQTLVTMELDIPVAVNVNFDTKVGSAAAVPAKSQYARLQSAGLPAPFFLQQSLSSYPSTNNTFTWASLFPFTNGYSAYAGMCDDNNPTEYVSSYTANAITVNPGGTYTITARMPSINIQVRYNNATLVGAPVKVYSVDPDCISTMLFPAQTSNSSGAMPNPGFPWGHYYVCADNSNLPNTTDRRMYVAIDNVAAAGTATTQVVIPTSGSSSQGVCA